MNISDAEKTVISGLTQKDESTIAATDMVQLYAQDGTPNGKISKADLMDAVKASLPALLSDQSTNGTDFLSLSSGVLGKMSAANLASVLGGLLKYKVLFSRRQGIFEESLSGYGFYILQEGGGTGDCLIFTISASVDGIHILSDSSNLLDSYYTITKNTVGADFTLKSNRTTYTSLAVINPGFS